MKFLELLMKMKMKMIVSENFSLLMIREVIVSLMLEKMLSLIDFEMMILEI
jgi:glycine/serine hydroxymethyltransferase